MKRGRRGGLLLALATGLGLCAALFACSSSGGLSGQGGRCTQFSDCQEDLICGKGPNGAGVCTNDPSSLQPAQGADATGAPPKAMGDAAADDGGMTGDSSAPVSDAEVLETASPIVDAEARDVAKPEDAGKVEDAGMPEDTGTQPPEAAAPPEAGGIDATGD